MPYLPQRLVLTRLWLALALLGGCGYIGYDTHEPDAEAEAPEDSGMDDASEPVLDAGTELDADTQLDADMQLDAELDASSQPDAAASDASVDMDAAPDAMLDAAADATLDVEVMDATPTDASEAGDAGTDARQATQVSDYCVQVPALPDEPVIDGVLDGALALLRVAPTGWSNANLPLPSHTTAEYALAFRPNGLYAFVRVHDPNRQPALSTEAVWRGDSVELYADSDGVYAMQHAYDNPGTIQIVVGAPASDTTPLMRATRYRDTADIGSWSSTRYAAYPTQDGYVVEAFLEASALDMASWGLSSGGRVGVDLGINVSAFNEVSPVDAGLPAEGQRLGQYFLRVGMGGSCGGKPFCTPDAFCNPLLID